MNSASRSGFCAVPETAFKIAGKSISFSSDREAPPFTSLKSDLSMMTATIAPENVDAKIEIVARGYDDEVPEFSLPPGATLIRKGGRQVYQDNDTFYINFHGNAGFRISDRETFGICIGDERLDPLFWTELCLNHVVMLLLRRMGRYLIHAGGAQAPNGTLYLFTGDNGAGKSTAAMRLTLGGWKYFGDDVVLFDRNFSFYPYPKKASITHWSRERLDLEAHIVGERMNGKALIEPWNVGSRAEDAILLHPIFPRSQKNLIRPMTTEAALRLLSTQTEYCHSDRMIAGLIPDLTPLASRAYEIEIGDLPTLPEFLEKRVWKDE